MAKLLKLRRGTTSQHGSFTGAEGEVTVDTTKDTLVVHDGSTAGGHPIALESANLSLIDEDDMASNSASRPPSQQSVKAYADTKAPAVLDEDNLGSDSATRPPSQQSVKAYVDAQTLSLIDEDNLGSDAANRPPSQQSVKAYVDALPDVIDEDDFSTDSATRPPSQQSVKAYIQTVSNADAATYATINNSNLTGTATGVNLTLSGNLTVNGTTTTINSSTISVDDKNLELGSVDTPSDTTADGGGITLKGGTDKEIKWVDATNNWTFNQNIEILKEEGTNAELFFTADDGDDNADKWKFVAFDDPANTFDLYNYTSGSWEKNIGCIGNGAVTLYHDNSSKFATSASGVTVTGNIVGSADVDILGHVLLDSGKYLKGVMQGHGDKIIAGYASGSTTLDIGESATLTVGGLLTSTSVADSKGNLRSIPQNAKTANYTLLAADAGKHILCNTASITITYNPNTFDNGDAITIVNNTTGDVNINNSAGTNMQSTLGNGNRVLASRGMATILTVDDAANGTGYISGTGLS